MEPLSLGYRTDLILLRNEGARITRLDDGWKIHSPNNPTFHWGNLLLFDRPPVEGDLKRWEARFAQEFDGLPGIRHRTFGWDAPEGTPGDIQPFLEAGYKASDSVVLTSQKPQTPPRWNDQVQVHTLHTDAEWEDAIQVQLQCNEDHEEVGYETFLRRHMGGHRRMVEAGRGRWFGAFLDGRQVANLGLFVENGVGRYQMVGTALQARRQGVCQTLVDVANRTGLTEMGAHTLVIVADRHQPVARLYQSTGFLPTERQIGVSWYPND